MNKCKLMLLTVVIMVSTSTSYTYAACPIDGITPLTVGPVNPQNGFPQWIQDTNGTSLELCLGAANCIFDPVVPDNLFSQQIGFGGEGFWWMADAIIDNASSGLSARLIQASEAAFSVGDPVNGQQFPFTRLRIRVDVPAIGTYTITHPFGESVFTVDSVGVGNEINSTIDLPLAADTQHQGAIGPFLTSTSAPAGFLGDGVTATTVTGSPCGTNFFRIKGVSTTGTPLNLDGSGGNLVQTDQFTVMGKLYSGVTNTPLNIERVTYARTTAGQVDVFATAPIGATVTVSGDANLPTGNTALIDDGQGNYAAHLALTNASVMPPSVSITAQNGTNSATTLLNALIDQVTITKAEFDQSTSTLLINARSSDEFSTPPVLTVEGIGTMVNGVLSQAVSFGPAFVTVTSSAGGAATLPVTFVSAANPGTNTAPVAVDDAATTIAGVAIVLNVLANDSDAENDPLTVMSTTQGTNGAVTTDGFTTTYTPVAGFTGTDQFTYTIQDINGAQATATATIVVDPVTTTEALTPTLVECRTSKQEWRVSGTSSAPAGTVITLYVGATVAGSTALATTGSVDATSNWSIREKQSPITCASPVSLTSSTGAVLENLSVNIRN